MDNQLPASGIRQKKGLSQVFLKSEMPAKMTIATLRDWDVDEVIEVGPGSGALTLPLLKDGFTVTALERDSRFVEYLSSYESIYEGHFTIINEDVLNFDLSGWLATRKAERCAVVGNIPYHISTPIITWVLPHLPKIQGAIFLTQLEFARRLAAKTSTKDYGSLSVFTQLRCQPKIITKVEKELFKPVPKVDSALIALRPRSDMPGEEILRRTEKVCRAAFSQRRKQLANSLKAFLAEKQKDASPIDLQLRPEVLQPEEFITLADFILPKPKD